MPSRPALWERGMASLSEAIALLGLCLAAVGRWGDLLFLLLYPAWCAFWETKIHSRPIHWLLGWRLAPLGRFTAARPLARGLLRLLFPLLHLGWRGVTLFDLCTRCRWTVRALSATSSRSAAPARPVGYR